MTTSEEKTQTPLHIESSLLKETNSFPHQWGSTIVDAFQSFLKKTDNSNWIEKSNGRVFSKEPTDDEISLGISKIEIQIGKSQQSFQLLLSGTIGNIKKELTIKYGSQLFSKADFWDKEKNNEQLLAGTILTAQENYKIIGNNGKPAINTRKESLFYQGTLYPTHISTQRYEQLVPGSNSLAEDQFVTFPSPLDYQLGPWGSQNGLVGKQESTILSVAIEYPGLSISLVYGFPNISITNVTLDDITLETTTLEVNKNRIPFEQQWKSNNASGYQDTQGSSLSKLMLYKKLYVTNDTLPTSEPGLLGILEDALNKVKGSKVKLSQLQAGNDVNLGAEALDIGKALLFNTIHENVALGTDTSLTNALIKVNAIFNANQDESLFQLNTPTTHNL